MVMTSDMIASQIGAFQQQSMGQMQHAAMLSQNVGAGHMASSMMGGIVNTAGAVAGPAAGLGLAVAGLDPLSIGMRVGMGVGRFGGIAGGIGAGALAAGGAMLPIMAAQYAGGQMLTGMQQQQQLDETLRHNFGAAGAFGRGGFTAGQMGQIGGMLRAETGTFGPHHQMATFGELTQMVQGMAQMGMMPRPGVGGTSLQEFTTRFRTMLREVKEIAQTFNTTLTEAQEMMGSMRQSGVFNNQGAVAREVRQWAMAGGLATTEVSAMMNIGSQISRSIGGRGRAGAMAGMRTIGQIGIANQMGFLSEEDIYNVTGLTGAEGRQAYATQQLQQSAEFLRGSFGRRFLASVAGRNGALDPQSALAWMSGDVGTGDTMAMAGRNLGRVGRANFIRNEARLRGAALEQFGGLTQMMVMRNWLEGRGFDLTSGEDDRAMVWLQRRQGMTADQAEQAMNMMRNLPSIMREQQSSAADASMQQRMEGFRSRQGIRGVKRKLEEFRNTVNNQLQEVGANIYKEGENFIERWLNRLTGDFYEYVSKDVGRVSQQLFLNADTEGTRRLAQQRLGVRGGDFLASKFMSQVAREYGGPGGDRDMEMWKTMDRSRFEAAGYGFGPKEPGWGRKIGGWALGGVAGAYLLGRGGEMTQEQMWAGIDQARRISGAALIGLEGKTAADVGAEMAGQKDFWRAQLLGGAFDKGRGRNMLGAFGQALERRGMTGGAMGAYGQMGEVEQAGYFGTAMRSLGYGTLASEGMAVPELEGLYGLKGRDRTEMDAATRYGAMSLGGELLRSRQEALGGAGRETALSGAAKTVDAISAYANFISGPIGWGIEGFKRWGKTTATDTLGKALAGVGAMDESVLPAYGRLMREESTQSLIRGVMSRDAGKQEEALNKLEEMKLKLTTQYGNDISKAPPDVRAQHEMMRTLSMTPDYGKLIEEHGGAENVPQEKKAEFERKHGMRFDDAGNRFGTMAREQYAQMKADQRAIYSDLRRRGEAVTMGFQKAGVIGEGGRLSATALEGLAKIGKKEAVTGREFAAVTGQQAKGTVGELTTGQQAFGMIMQAQEALRKIQPGGDDAQNRQLYEQYEQLMGGGYTAFARMSVTEQRAVAGQFLQGGTPEAAELSRGLMQRSGLQQKLTRMAGRGGAQQAKEVMGMLGGTLTLEEMGQLRGKSAEEMTGFMMSKLGVTSKMEGATELKESLSKTFEALKDPKKAGEATKHLMDALSSPAVKEAEQKKKQEAAEQDPSYQMLAKMAGSMKNIEQAFGKPMTVRVSNTPLPTQDQTPPSCLLAGTTIAMADGTEKPIEEVVVGDTVLSADPRTGRIEESNVTAIFSHVLGSDLIDVNGLCATPNHPLLVGNAYVLAENLVVGMHLYSLSSKSVLPTRIHTLSRIPQSEHEGEIVHNIYVSKHGNYFAGGLLVSQECG